VLEGLEDRSLDAKIYIRSLAGLAAVGPSATRASAWSLPIPPSEPLKSKPSRKIDGNIAKQTSQGGHGWLLGGGRQEHHAAGHRPDRPRSELQLVKGWNFGKLANPDRSKERAVTYFESLI